MINEEVGMGLGGFIERIFNFENVIIGLFGVDIWISGSWDVL